jgi:hypothetical protein
MGRARLRQPIGAAEAFDELSPRMRELDTCLGGGRADAGDDLDLRRAQLLRKPRVAVDGRQNLVDHRREVVRLGVDEHQLLLDADREPVRVLERGRTRIDRQRRRLLPRRRLDRLQWRTRPQDFGRPRRHLVGYPSSESGGGVGAAREADPPANVA